MNNLKHQKSNMLTTFFLKAGKPQNIDVAFSPLHTAGFFFQWSWYYPPSKGVL